MNKTEANKIFGMFLEYTPFTAMQVKDVWLARYADMGLKTKKAWKPFTMWAAIRGRETRAGFGTRRDAIEWAKEQGL